MLKGRLLFDITKASRQKHKSGLLRVSECLRRELSKLLGNSFVEVVWSNRMRRFAPLKEGRQFSYSNDDILLTGELFCEYEREGVEAFLYSGECKAYSIFHDAIPLQHPEFTWPHSVQRHPSYMKMLALFDGVFAVSQHSAMLLEEYWEWLGYSYAPSVNSIQLGADAVFFESSYPRPVPDDTLRVLILGILEKRKGQDLALQAAKMLWKEGHSFQLDLVGRSNPYFGKDIERSIKNSIKAGYPIELHGQIDDEGLKALFESSHLLIFPSRAEGCGLPVLESLWKGVPVLCSNLSAVRETARFGGCRLFDVDDCDALASELRGFLLQRDQLRKLTEGIRTDMLPRWENTAKSILDHFS